MRVLDAGESCILLEFHDVDEVLVAFETLDTQRRHGIIELVPSQRSLLVEYDETTMSRDAIVSMMSPLKPLGRLRPTDQREQIDVRYDGDDLDGVCDLLEMDRNEFITWHTSAPWTAAFNGFSPGFAYTVRHDHTNTIPRLGTPRVAVPAGAVALGGEFCGIYPRESPGGWRIVGYTDARLWNLEKSPPALLSPGTLVDFRAVS